MKDGDTALKGLQNLFRAVFYFLAGLCMTILLFWSVFQLGKSVYSTIQYSQIRNQFSQVSAEIVAIESYAPFYCAKDKDYKVTMTYEYDGKSYQHRYDYKKMPKEALGDWVVLQVSPLDPKLTKIELMDSILTGILLVLAIFSTWELVRCRKKSTVAYIKPFSAQSVLIHLEKLNRKEMHRTLRCLMAMILSFALISVNDSEQISWFLLEGTVITCIGAYMLFRRIVRGDQLKNDEVHLVLDTCLEKRIESFEDGSCYYLLLEESEKAFSVSEKTYHRIHTGDSICLAYYGKSRKKPYLMCMEKR